LVAQILAERGDVRERFPAEDQLATEAGVCPLTHASGKSPGVVFRSACNKNRRLALTCFADNSRHARAWATGHATEGAAIYQKPVSVGASTPRSRAPSPTR
jgi:transposase